MLVRLHKHLNIVFRNVFPHSQLVKKNLLKVGLGARALAVSENCKQKFNRAIYLGKSDGDTVD